MRIEICGGIGAGKTTLAKLLGNSFSPVNENFKSNPFWEAYFSNPDKFNFETEITFLLQHYHDIKLALEKYETFVCDFSFYQDLAYAKKGLSGNRLRIFEEIFNEGLKEFGRPNLLICLKCNPATLIKRIKNRGRKEEECINLNFLTKLTQNTYSEAENFTGHVLYINSQRYNFASNLLHQEQVVKLIQSFWSKLPKII